MDNFNPDNVEFVEKIYGETKFQGSIKDYFKDDLIKTMKLKDHVYEDHYADTFEFLRIQSMVDTYRCTKIEVFHKHLDQQERWLTLQVLLTFENDLTFSYITKYQKAQYLYSYDKMELIRKGVNKAFTLFEERLKHNQLLGYDAYEFDL